MHLVNDKDSEGIARLYDAFGQAAWDGRQGLARWLKRYIEREIEISLQDDLSADQEETPPEALDDASGF